MNKPLKNDPRLIEFARQNRRTPTPAEKAVWNRLRSWRDSGIPWRRQHIVEPYILDFACVRAKVALELDGDTHVDQIEYDQTRTKSLENSGWLVIRLWNHQIHEGAGLFFDHLFNQCESRIEAREKSTKD